MNDSNWLFTSYVEYPVGSSFGGWKSGEKNLSCEHSKLEANNNVFVIHEMSLFTPLAIA